jgi:ABC-type branched-subunit amino acid transport system substrate-binding protein
VNNWGYVTSPLLSDIASEDIQEFNADFIAAHDDDPGWPAVFSYDAAKVIVQAIAVSGLIFYPPPMGSTSSASVSITAT